MINLEEFFTMIGVVLLLLVILIIMFIPILAILICGDYIAVHHFHLTGLVYWCFIVLFYILVSGVIGCLVKLSE